MCLQLCLYGSNACGLSSISIAHIPQDMSLNNVVMQLHVVNCQTVVAEEQQDSGHTVTPCCHHCDNV